LDATVQIEKNVDSFSVFNEELRLMLSQAHLSELILNDDTYLFSLLNGRASEVLQHMVSQDIRKKSGIFFTNHALSNQLAEKISGLLSKGIKVADPACGSGDLLLACAKYLPLGRNLVNTIKIWSELLSGSDLFDEFILATKLRLILMAAIRSKDNSTIGDIISGSDAFPNFERGDFLTTKTSYKDIDCFIINPPFGYINAPYGCEWASGKIQSAAWFLEKLFSSSHPGQHILAILPDVLRSGTRYSKWRKVIGEMSSNIEVEAAGRFDAGTDVDVFILHAIVRSKNEISVLWPTNKPIISFNYTNTISDYFDVCVGTIVPHRDPKEGQLFPYLHAKNVKKGQLISNISETILTKRKVFDSPFVVLHRTSSPNDNPRCVASIVNDTRKSAVENHLIILKPKKDDLNMCQRLMNVFSSQVTDSFLNQRIRCRHLTVSSINEIPWIEG
jgi:hypothetical protein